MPPPPAGCTAVGGSRSKGDRSASDSDRPPQPGPLGLGSGSQSLPGAARSHSEYGSRSSPAPSGVAEDDRFSTFDSVNLDRDDLFRFVFCLIRDFHSLGEPASVSPNRCKTSLAPVYGLQSQSSPALHLPLSTLLRSLLKDTNLALAKFMEDQTVHGFLPVPSRRHRKYCRTSSSSFPGLCKVPPGLASITLGQVSCENILFLCHSHRSPLWRLCSRVCVRSHPGWSGGCPCGSFQEHLTDEECGNFGG